MNHGTEFSLGALAAVCSATITNPLEVVKTRMQLQGELKARGQYTVFYRNTFHALYTIAKYDGLRGLQSGLAPALGYQISMNGTRLGSFQIMIDMGLTDSVDCTFCGFLRTLLAAGLSGAVSNAIGSPFFMIKTHIQCKTDSKIAVGFQHSHKTMYHAVKEIVRQDGVKGLWRGASAGTLRGFIGSAAQLGAFASTKKYLISKEIFDEDSIMISILASMVGGISLVFFMTPFDVVCIRLYNQRTTVAGKGMYYKGISDCFRKTYISEGIAGLYKGWEPSLIRLWPHTVLCLVFWDYFRDTYYKWNKSKS
ncbi:solute carrier family 25 member 35-like [Mytilus trossulus]|uniref:solute carrier family 25 member 35-like n=1 Tax=Mytilus trossulus TaxID=6551 RepID=UPI003003D68C